MSFDDVKADFDNRVGEVDQYLKVLDRLNNPAVVLFDSVTRRRKRVLEEGSLKVMKATVFLLIYNVVESSIRSGFEYLYANIKSQGSTPSAVRDELVQVWIRQRFRALDADSVSTRNFRDLAESIVEEVVAGSVLDLDSKLLPVSGNLDAERIREVCAKHGVSSNVHYRSLGGTELITVRKQRNALAHGNTTFSECGQQYTVSDLIRINNQAQIFVRGILKNIEKYVSAKEYEK